MTEANVRVGAEERSTTGEPASSVDARRTTVTLPAATPGGSEPAIVRVSPPELEDAPEVPQRIGRYRIVRELGRGGVGVVYEAVDTQMDRPVALKTLIAGRDASDTQLQRFLLEVRAAATLRHPHIVAVHDAGTLAGRLYLAMDLIVGRPLADMIARDGPLPPRRAVELVLPIVRALDHAHTRGIVHRDVKPENVMVDATGEPYLMDFGLAQDLRTPGRLTGTGQTVGTPYFMAPEQLRGGPVDARADTYSIGATLYESVTGRVPFQADSFPDLMSRILSEEPTAPRLLQSRIAPDLEAIILQCLEKDPARRYASAADLAADLERFLHGEAVRAHAPSSLRRAARRVRENVTAVAGALVAVAGIVGAAWFALALRREHEDAARLRLALERERASLLEAHQDALATVRREEAQREALGEAALAASPEARIAAYDRLLARYPDAWEGRVARARLLRTMAQARRVGGEDAKAADDAIALAVADLQAAIEAAAQRAPLLLLLAEVLRADAKDQDGALAAYREVARLDAGALADYARGRLALAAGDAGAAASHADRCLLARADLDLGRLLRGEAHLRAGRPDMALGELDRLAATEHLGAEVCRLRGEALLALGDLAEAADEAERAVALDPSEPAAYLVLGRVRLAAAEPGRALAALERAAKLDEGSALARLLQARAFAVLGDLERAADLVREARALGGALDAALLHDLELQLKKEDGLPGAPKM